MSKSRITFLQTDVEGQNTPWSWMADHQTNLVRCKDDELTPQMMWKQCTSLLLTFAEVQPNIKVWVLSHKSVEKNGIFRISGQNKYSPLAIIQRFYQNGHLSNKNSVNHRFIRKVFVHNEM